MQEKLYGWKYTRHLLVIAYIAAVFCLPWGTSSYSYYRAINQQHSKDTEEPAHSVLVLSERPLNEREAAQAEGQIKQCAQRFICRVIDYRAIRIVDVSTDDPTAFFTIVLALSTIGLWFQTWKLSKGAEAQATDIQAQLTVARDDFNSTHRPWVGFSAKIGSPIKFAPDGMRFDLIFTCKNTGSTPAIGTSINAKAFLYLPVISDLEKQKAICVEMHGPWHSPTARGKSLFPGEEDTFVKSFFVPQPGLDTFVAEGKKIYVTVAGCIDYCFSFGDDSAHQSGFIYYVGKKVAGDLAPIVVAEGDLAVGSVYLRKAAFAGAFFAT